MITESWRIACSCKLIGEILEELFHSERARSACGSGKSKREPFDDALSTYKREMEKLNKKVSALERENAVKK